MPVRCKEEAELVLGAHFRPFARIILDSVAQYYQEFGPAAYALEVWTQRGIVRDLAKERMIAYCEVAPGLGVERRGNSTTFVGSNIFRWKIKKLSDTYRANVSGAQTAIEFDCNLPAQGELFPDADATTLYLGYIPTTNDPLKPPVYLVCNNELGEPAWTIRLDDLPPLDDVVEIKPAPTPGSSPATPSRVRVKRPPGAANEG